LKYFINIIQTIICVKLINNKQLTEKIP